MIRSNASLRRGLLAGASVMAIVVTAQAQAQIFGRRGAGVDPAVAAAHASETAATRNVAAQAAATRTRAAFARAAQVRTQMDGVQAAARAAALAATSIVPNGLGAGGLQVASGVALDPSLWVGAGGPTQTIGGGRTQVTIGQTQEKAILTWDSFNVGRETDLVFDQKGNANWVALNRVTNVNADPSKILGSIKADGAVYIINRNGIIFGGASQINTRSLIASSLDIHAGAIEYTRPAGATDVAWEKLKVIARNQRFKDGLLAANPSDGMSAPPTFSDGDVFYSYFPSAANPQVKPDEVFAAYDGVTVEAGARITTGANGQAVLLGHNVTNHGTISATAGQVMLAAGRSVVLLDGAQRMVRSETGSIVLAPTLIPGFAALVDRGGVALNDGVITSARGNVSLTAKNVTQNGVIAVTAGVQQQGSIVLDASNGNVPYGQGSELRYLSDAIGNGVYKGTMTFGSGSYTSILPDDSGATTVGNTFKAPNIAVVGNQIVFAKNATLWAPGANVSLRASDYTPELGTPFNNTPGRIYIDAGATIDLAGLNGIDIAMAQNSIKAELRANELANNPVLRGGVLRGQTVYFDARLGGKLADGTGVANLAGYYDLIQRDAAQFMTIGGSLTLHGAEIIAREGSTIDISGGSVRYGDGLIKRTNLIDAYGRIVPIEQAIAGVNYVGLEGDFIVGHARWGVSERYVSAFSRDRAGTWQAGYDEGRSAGKLTIEAGQAYIDQTDFARIFEGDVKAGVIIGDYQADAPTGAGVTNVTALWHQRPTRGTLLMSGLTSFGTVVGGDITIADLAPRLGADFTAASVLFDASRGAGFYLDVRSRVEGVEAREHYLPTDWFDGKNFGNVTLFSGDSTSQPYLQNPDDGTLSPRPGALTLGGVLTIGQGVKVDLGDYGAFRFVGRQAEIDGTIRAAGGSVTLETTWMAKPLSDYDNWSIVPAALRPGTRLGATGQIDVAGRWSNNYLEGLNGQALTTPVVNGGKVNIFSYNIDLEKGSRIDVGGGASLGTDGATLTLGNGGAITLDSTIGVGRGSLAATDGRLVLDGTLSGYAPGKGGTLTLDTGFNVVIANQPLLADGVLGAGVAAPISLTLAKDFTIKAGQLSPIPATYQVDVVPAGNALPTRSPYFYGESDTTVSTDWTVPRGVYAYADNFNVTFYPGDTVPAGTTLMYIEGNLPANYVIPAAIFPNGINFGQPITLNQPAGPLIADFTIPAGYILPSGVVFEQAIEVVAPRSFTPDFFTQGGFANFGVSGGNGMTVMSGTTIAPAVDTLTLTGAVRDVASGANLRGLAGTAGSGVTLVNSATLPESQRQTTDLTLSTITIGRDSRYSGGQFVYTQASFPGTLTVEKGATIALAAGSTMVFDGIDDMFIDGTVSTPGGTIRVAPRDLQFYDQNSTIRIGENARLLAAGYQKTVLSGGFEIRSVQSGGTISIGNADYASGNQNAGSATLGLAIGAGAVLDVSGVRGVTDLAPGAEDKGAAIRLDAPYVAVATAGAAGSITINRTGGVIAGDLRLAAGGASGRGGTLAISATQGAANGIVVRQSAGTALLPVTVHSAVASDALTVIADRLNGSGADSLVLYTNNVPGVRFDGDVSLTATRAITISASSIYRTGGVAAAVTVAAPYVMLGFFGTGGVPARDLAAPVYATDLNGSFTVNAGLIDVAGWVPFQCITCAAPTGGFGTVSLVSRGDIRLSPFTSSATRAFAGISAGGDLILDAAQVYVTNGLSYSAGGYPYPQYDRVATDPGFLVRAGKSITVKANGAAAPVPLNFGERLTLRAPVITQAGILRAPAGQIRLEASDTLTLAPGSLTSVSLEGMIVPFGLLDTRSQFSGYGQVGFTPTRTIDLGGATVTVGKGATVDVSAGGDLLGWTFTSGTGGTNNILADQSATGAFAILPSLGAGPAPLHLNASIGSSDYGIESSSVLNDERLNVGDAVWLSDVPGLAAGYYTLLPASYALMQGAFLIKPIGGATAGAVAASARDDGSTIVSGYKAVTGTAIRDQAWSSYQVMNGDTWRQYSEIATYSFNTMKAAQAAEAGISVRTLADAGTIALKASKALDLSGTVLFATKNGLIGNLDVAASQIALVTSPAAAPAGYLAVDAGQLQAFGADASILIGGTRPRSSFDQLLVDTGTTPSDYSNSTITAVASNVLVGDGVTFRGNELLLSASDAITIGKGAALTATGKAKLSEADLALTGNGALVRLSSSDRLGLVRTGSTGGSGAITVRDGATFTTAGALSFDASAGFNLSANAVFDVTQLDLASDGILLGTVPVDAVGTVIGLDTLARLAKSSDLLLRGHRSIAFYGDLALGTRDAAGIASLGAITLDTALIAGNGGKVTLTAGTLTLQNSGAAIAPAVSGTGLLSLDVDTLALGTGTVATSGFRSVNGAAGTVSTSETGAFAIAGDLDLAVGRLVATTGTKYAVTASGALSLRQGKAAKADSVAKLGGSLSLTAASVMFDTVGLANAGTLALTATAGDLTLGQHAVLDVSGAAVDFRDVVKFAPGGIVRLSASANVTSTAGSLIDISGADRGGAGGMLNVTAGGAAGLAGAITATVAKGYAGGEFAQDAGTTDFSALTTILNTGTVNGARDIRLRQQDILLKAGERIEAHTVSLRSDSGAVTIAGTIAAAGTVDSADGGTVRLSGRTVTLEGTGRIEAAAAAVGTAAYQPAAGNVVIAADQGRAVLAAGSVIDVSGGREGGGRVQVRAARSGGAELSGTVTGAREKALIGMATLDTATIDGAMVRANLGGWGATAPAGWDVGTGLLVRSAGDLTVAGTIDLGSVGGVGYLGFDAGGDLLINASISDGFASAATTAALDSGKSFSYGFQAGRDIVLAGGQLIRTGTGDIAIAAGRDLTLTNNASVIYTAGSATPTGTGFDRTGYGTAKDGTTRVLGDFPTLGGSISLGAGRDITAPVVNQSASAWLFRYGNASWDGNPANSNVLQQTNWSIIYRNFQYGVGALGGGNVRVRAGGSVTDLAVAIPTTGYLTNAVGGVAIDADLVVRGGGDLDLRAGGNIGGGAFVLGKGRAQLIAAGTVGAGKVTSVVTGNPYSTSPTLTTRGLNPLFGLMDATVSVSGGQDVTIEGAYDLTMSPQICENIVGTCATTLTGYTSLGGIGSAFVSYSARTALDAVSVAGDIAYINNGWAGTSVSLRNANPGFIIRPAQLPAGPLTPLSYFTTASVSPGLFRLASLSGDLLLNPTQLSGGLTLAPSPLGTLDLLAAGNVQINYSSNNGPIVLQDVGVSYIRNALMPFAAGGVASIDRYADPTQDTLSNIGNNFYRSYDLLHASDPDPLHIIALTGFVGPDATAGGGYQTWGLQSPKPVDIYAGTDIVHPLLTFQNNSKRQVSSIVAGRDINLLRGSISILGEGLLWVETGRDYTVDKSTQISNAGSSLRSLGNASTVPPVFGVAIANYALADIGADINMIAGTAQGAGNYAGFADLYLDPAHLADPAFGLSHASNAGKVVHVYDRELEAFLKSIGFTGVSSDNRRGLFDALPAATRSSFLQRVLVGELRETGIDYNATDGARYQQYTRGYNALEALFPVTAGLDGARNPRGNILLDNALVESRSGGNLSLFAPYGRVAIGNPLSNQDAASAGIITRRGGDISILANGTISLEQARVFTLQGGDVLMWTSQGDITAGVGAKTSVSNVPLSYLFDKSGYLTLNTFGLSTGAGIGVLDALEGREADRDPSRLDLLAFFGEVNAGDAGIRVVGDLNIAALRVVNADNIQVSGDAAGIPVARVVNVGALTAASAATSAVSNEAARIAERARPQPVRDVPTIVNVRFLGFGEF